MKLIYVDIDETICNREASSDFGVVHDYTKAQPIKENIEKRLFLKSNKLGRKSGLAPIISYYFV